ncbi:hypothetical protein HWV62_25104 [Athelia sp. TMB]|nr:hypothetical protein HWV62_25104 [Athelia sp. TMB]
MVPFLQDIPENLPILERLYINGPGDSMELPCSLSNFRHAPTLRDLTLDRRISLAMPEVPWAQLTKCTLMIGGRYTCEDGYHVISQAANLRSFTISIDAPSTSTSLPSLVRQVNLVSLEIWVTPGESAESLFDICILPALAELKFRGSRFDSSPEYLANFVIRSGCLLKQLGLGIEGITSAELELLFNLTPALSELASWGNALRIPDVSIDLLTHRPNHSPGKCCLLPKLTSIKVSVHEGFSYEKFVKLLSSRRGVVACGSGGTGLAQLRKATLMITQSDEGRYSANGRRTYHLPWDTYNDFVDLRDNGLDFLVHKDDPLSLEDYFLPGDAEDDSDEEEGFEHEEDHEFEDEDEYYSDESIMWGSGYELY